MIVKSSIASESTHWYQPDGTPAYEITGMNGKLRPTTLRDAKKLGLLPSVTTILKQLDKPALTNWLVDQALLSAITLPRIENESEDAFMARAKDDAKQQSQNARDLGTKIHGSIECSLKSTPYDSLYAPHVEAVMETLAKLSPGGQDSFKSGFWASERSFAYQDTDNVAFGGKCDLYSDAGVVVDFKTKDFDENKLPEVYEEHRLQLAAYAHGLKVHWADRYILYVSTKVPGLVRLCKIEVDDKDTDWETFKLLAKLFKIRKGL